MSAYGSACERVADLEAALLAADEELGHQMRKISALEQECCRIVSQLRGALRSAASSERGRVAAEARAGASEAETRALRQRLDVLRRRQGQLEGGTELGIAQRRPSFTASSPRPERTSFSTPSTSLRLRDTCSTLQQIRPPVQLIPEDASLRPRPPFGAGGDLIAGPRSPIGGVVSNEIRLRRLILRLEQQLSTEREVHAEQLGQLHPNDPAGLAALAAENQRLRGELAATIAERDALAAFVNVSRSTEPRTDHSNGSARPPATSGLAARDE